MTFKVTFAVLNQSNSHTSGNMACINYDYIYIRTEKSESACGLFFDTQIQNEWLFKVAGSHIYCKCCNFYYFLIIIRT